MNVVIKKRIFRGSIKWVVDVEHDRNRRRKYFNPAMEAKAFDVVAWMGDVKEKELVGDETFSVVARNLYLAEYLDNHFNPSKRIQKGCETTEKRVNKFVNWIGEGISVTHLTMEDYKKYVNSGNWQKKQETNIGDLSGCLWDGVRKKGYGCDVSNWYIQTNSDLKMTKKRLTSGFPRYACQKMQGVPLDCFDFGRTI